MVVFYDFNTQIFFTYGRKKVAGSGIIIKITRRQIRWTGAIGGQYDYDIEK